MPKVASESLFPAHNRSFASNARPSYGADRAPAAPFDSLIDNSPPPAPEPRAQRSQKASDDNSPRADHARARHDSAKSSQHNDKTRDSGKAADNKAAPGDAPAKSESAAKEAGTDDASAKTKPNTPEQAARDALKSAGEGDKTKAGGKPADSDTAGGAVTGQAPGQPVAPDASQVPAPVAAPVPGQTPAVAGDDAIAVAAGPAAAPPVDATAQAAATDPAGAKAAESDVLAALQGQSDKAGKKAGAGKPAGDATADAKSAAKTDTKAATPFDPDGTLQAANGATEKNPAEHPHAQIAANSHRGVGADGQAKPAANDKTAAPNATADLAQPNAPTASAQGGAQGAAQVAAHAANQAMAAPAAAAAPPAPPSAAVPLAGVAIEITNKVSAGKNQFDIRLDPPELGRIHVRLNVDRDGNVITHMVADRTDTLDLLRRDTAGLERALQDAGLKTSGDSLQFSLRDQSADQQQNNGGGNSAHLVVEDESAGTVETASRNYSAYGTHATGLDIRV
ncbi:MAG: flagellar hook-length control protein FliK [Pseudolabrys sp.]|nr:flagellar hook-length control protein FliK [Pseudolabrys sp.]